MIKVLVPLANGFEEIEAITIIDVLDRAHIDVVTASINHRLEVQGAHGITVVADMHIVNTSSDDIDMIILPGGWGGTKILAGDENIQFLLKQMQEKDKLIGAICAAPYALKRAGILPQNYTCYPSVEDDIDQEGYDKTKKIIQDGNIITSQGPATAMCFALEIVKLLKGVEEYNKIKKALLADMCA